MTKRQKLSLEVLDYLLTIPKDKLMTYESLWRVFWVNPRIIWKIIKANLDFDTFPCYKICETKKKIWFYNWKNWIHWKLQKIKDDWIEVLNWKIDEKYFM